MKWLIASDIHGSVPCTTKLLHAIERENADRVLLLGDLLYHGPRNGLPEGYDPAQIIDLLNTLKNKVLCVRGNCDSDVDQMVLEFPIMAEYAILPVGTRLLYATHGHNYGSHNPPPFAEGDILLHGHTHVPVCEDMGGYTYMNPGSVSIPKGGSVCSYMTLEDGLFLWKDLDGKEYMRAQF